MKKKNTYETDITINGGEDKNKKLGINNATEKN